ncbi:acetaldehyde dehydrogenase (acetylating) [Paenibacillus qinlingensis]|uniref:Acetaldehyde dehydrogenase (Acetylating) n=1 Tax=Paenibacillus qinlingensis TaxID=1837343 RepID=A0ABU1NU26_9BACL|nr:acetaldehyde dehydrogenase (acetylating) [Paenibacillus qinlingensis]MDR6550566.1 acetaldehyde dehydrogenase (acetylating) [Paenibacillus qinlingensis]
MQLDKDLQAMQEMRDAVKRAKAAQSQFQAFSQQDVDRIVKALADAAFGKAFELASLAVEETGLGVVEHKVIKNQVASRDVYASIRDLKTVGVINEFRDKKIIELAAPFGVIAGIVPTTNPTSTAIFTSLIALKARNAIVFSPHPSAAKCTVEAARICSRAAVAAGAPEGLIGWITQPTMEATEGLMKHADIHLILATGGSALVKAAYSSGKPAYGVGPGNVPVYIEKSAEIAKAVQRIVDSKTFDHGTICASEQAVVVDRVIREMVMREFKNQGAYFLNEEEKKRLEPLISPAPGKLNSKIVGRSAKAIADMAGVHVPSETRLLIAEESQIGRDVPFSIEKLAPVFAFYTAAGWEEAAVICEQLLDLGGRGHTLALHTTDDEIARTFALRMPVSRIVVNTPSALGAVGSTTGLQPSFTLGCGSFGGNITSDNLTAHHLMTVKRLAYGIKQVDIPKPAIQTYPVSKSTGQPNQEERIAEFVNLVLDKVGATGHVDKATVIKLVQQVMAHI